jgi:hypothetical protein
LKLFWAWLLTRCLSFWWVGSAENWLHGDVTLYLDIAQNGYHGAYLGNYGWMPFFPLLIAGLSVWMPPLWAALVISNLALAGVLWLWRKHPGAWLLLFFPSSFYLTAPLSESLFLLCSLGALEAARRGHSGLAALCGALASLTRIVGIALLPWLWMQLPKRRAWLTLMPLALFGFCLHLQQQVGDFWGYFHMQHRLQRYISGWTVLSRGRPLSDLHWLGIVFAALSLMMLVREWKRLSTGARIYCGVCWILPGWHSLWVSQPRLMLAIFPIFTGAPRLLLLLCGLLQLFMLRAFVQGHPAFLY